MTPTFAGKGFLADWKTFREQLPPTDEAISEVVEFWKACPTVNRTFDPYDPSMWPTAWELMDEGLFCKSGLALAMAYTLIYSDTLWITRIELAMIEAFSDRFLVVIIDNKMIINYSYGVIEELPQEDLRIFERFRFADDKFEPINIQQ